MKAITIWQPFASLIGSNAKKFETRGWATKYRGPIAIHAAQKDPCRLSLADKPELKKYVMREIVSKRCPSFPFMPTGAIIATAELVNVWRIVQHPGTDVDVAKHIPIGAESLTLDKHALDFGAYFVPTEQEMAFGDWTPGRYAWELKNVKLLPHPIPVKGQQGLWNFAGACSTCRHYDPNSLLCCDGCDGLNNWEERATI